MSGTSEHASGLQLDLAVLGELAPELSAHLAGCAQCADELEKRRAEQGAFAQSDEPERAAAQILARLPAREPRRTRWTWLFAPLAAATAAAVALVVVRPAATDGLRTKGGPVVEAYVQRGDASARALQPGEQLRAGDAVQLTYRAAGYRQLTVFEVEGACAVHRELSQPVDEARTIARSWRLDAAPAGERLYVAFAAEPVDPADFERALRAAGGCAPGAAPTIDAASFSARGVVLRSEVAR